MKLLNSLLKMRQVKEAYKEITDADFVEINKRLITQGGVIKRGESGEIRVSTEGDSTLTQAGRKAPRKNVSEASALHDVEIDDKEEKPEQSSGSGSRTADQLEIGDVVEISGNVQYRDQTGEITRFGKDKKFVVVKLYGIGEHSFHSSDVVEAEKEYEETDEDGEDEEQDKFYVAFYDEDEERSWIGMVTKEGGGKWHEKQYKGKPEYRWGQTYMSYLKPDDIMSWIHKDYRRGIDIEGPFFDAREAEHHVKSNWGTLEEAKKEEAKPLAPDLPQTPDVLHAAIMTVAKKLAAASYIGADGKRIIKKIVANLAPTVKRPKDFMHAYGVWLAEEPDAMDLFLDELFSELGIKNVEQLQKLIGDTTVSESISAMDALNEAAKEFGKDFRLLEAEQAIALVDFKAANALAEMYGKNRFWSLAQQDMVDLINKNPDVLIGEAAKVLKTKKDEVQKRKIADVIHLAHNALHHMAEEELVACKVYRVEVIGNENKVATSGNVTVGFYADCHDKPRKKGLQKDLTDKLQERLNKHPFDGVTVKCKVFHQEIDGSKLKEDAHDSWKDVESWKTAVKNAYPEKAAKLKFKAKIENGVSTISAEVSGEDRSYGVWDMEEKKGYVLGESKSA